MTNRSAGSIPLFTLWGIDVSLHWSWFLIAMYEFTREAGYSSMAWQVAEYLALFAIVLMHEFGHALACRSVGGTANRIMLWPLGGVAFVNPPNRAGAQLWSIAAGPLVNVILLPVTFAFYIVAETNTAVSADAVHFAWMLMLINGVLLAFNLLPIYPLDGGQIFRSLLWFFVGPVKSLLVASVMGMAAIVIGLGLLAINGIYSWWLLLIALFAASQCWVGFRSARLHSQFLAAPRHQHVACPACGAQPPAGAFWACGCGKQFDTFANSAVCPKCGVAHELTSCPSCGRASPIGEWQAPAFPVVLPPTPLSTAPRQTLPPV